MYGDIPQLTEFLEKLKDKFNLDEHGDQNAAKIYVPIPTSLIVALVPLEGYEKSQLIG